MAVQEHSNQPGKNNIPASARFAIVVSRYNSNITGNLKDGAIETLQNSGATDEQIEVFWVPGAWEISLVADRLAQQNVYSAIICLGAVIKGETTHDEHINRQVSLSLGQISLNHQIPIQFGILTCNSLNRQFIDPVEMLVTKGEECANAAIEMVLLFNHPPFN